MTVWTCGHLLQHVVNVYAFDGDFTYRRKEGEQVKWRVHVHAH